jgi:hypothetical protein
MIEQPQIVSCVSFRRIFVVVGMKKKENGRNQIEFEILCYLQSLLGEFLTAKPTSSVSGILSIGSEYCLIIY